MKSRQPNLLKLIVSAAAVCLLVPGIHASAQVIDDVEQLEWDRPEAWAMKYFNSVSLLTGLGAPQTRRTWSFEIGLELDNIPQLSEDQRRIGFGGTKVEDLNRLPVFFRPRLIIGLPAEFSLEVAWVPPVEINGVSTNIFSAGVERPFYRSGALVLGGRLTGQVGTIEGDLTCTSEEASYPPGPPDNIWGGEAPSGDQHTHKTVSHAFNRG